MFAGVISANDIQQPINNKAIVPLTAPEHLKVATQKRNNDKPYVHEWEFIQEPTTLAGFTNYYDYMPGSYCGRPLMTQPDQYGGVYFVFHGKPSTLDYRKIYWAYVHPSGAIEYATITTSDTWQGYPGMTMHPASGDPIATWHSMMLSPPNGSCTCVSYDDYALLHIPGFWKDPVIFDQPEGHIWPYLFIGMSPDYSVTDNYRIYQISSCDLDGGGEYSVLRWIDVPEDFYCYGDLEIILNKDNWAGPVEILQDWSYPAGINCRPYPSFAVDPFNAGHVALFGYAGYVNGLTGGELVPQGYYVWDSYDGGATWDYANFHSYQTDVGMLNEYVLYAVENVPGFVNDEGDPFDSLHVWIGWPGNQCSKNRTATFDSDGNLHLPELFWICNVDEVAGSASYWPYYVFLFQSEVVYKNDGTWDIRHVADMQGIDAWTGLSVPWEIDPVNGDTLIYPWCDMAYADIAAASFSENTQRQAVNYENGWMVQVWVSGTKLLYAENGIPGYDEYIDHPIIYVSVSNNNGENWSAPIELSDIYSTAFPGFANMITMYPYVNPTIKDLGDGWGQIDMYFFDDNDYGSSIQGMGPNTGGQMVYCSFKVNFYPSYFYADFSADPLCGNAPLTVQFTDLSCGNITSRAWDFDYDGNIDSYAQNPQWTYNNPGTYTVSLTVSGSKSKSTDTETKIDYITVYDSGNYINIPGDYPTIQEGINAASDADTVLVQPGTYVENINYNGKNITVASLFLTTQDTSYVSQTIIDGDSLDSVVKFQSGEDTTAVLIGFTIQNGYAQYGGGIFCWNNSSPSLESLIISDNIASSRGGGILCYWNSSPILRNVIISGNSSSDEGGGICCSNDSSPRLDNVTISGNITSGLGGGICCNNNSSLSLENVIISDNSSYDDGGGMFCNNSSPILKNVIISGNSASDVGGGIHCRDHSSPSLENVTISDNSASDVGGGMYCFEYSSPSLVNVTISGNSASHRGGGLYLYRGSSSHLDNVIISGNSSSSRGGGILCYSSSPHLENVTISGNICSYGGGIYCTSSNMSLKNVIISGNSVSGYGGGMYCYDSSPSLENVTISGNSAYSNGGGLYCYDSSPHLVNVIVSHNSGNYGIYVDIGNPSINYSDFYDNENGNFWGCGQFIGVNLTINANGDSCDAYYNIQLDPLFADTLNGDYHLTWAHYPIPDSTMSPCIDAGNPTSPFDPDGTIADMGAFYFNQGGVSIDDPGLSPEFNLTNYPNPMSSNINNLTVRFFMKKQGNVTIQLFNVKGQLVSTLINEDKNVGDHSISYSVNDLSSGIYFTKMSIDGVDKDIKKVILLR